MVIDNLELFKTNFPRLPDFWKHNLLIEPVVNPCAFDENYHLWFWSLDKPETDLSRLFSFLNESERQKMSFFKTERLKQHYLISHGGMRYIISKYLDISPWEITYLNAPSGKPFISNAIEFPLFFNLSHNHDTACCAINRRGTIGVDLESTTKSLGDSEIDRLVEMVSHENDRIVVSSVSDFIAMWTIKEACIKAIGLGVKDLPEVQISHLSQQRKTLLGNARMRELKLRFLSFLHRGHRVTMALCEN